MFIISQGHKQIINAERYDSFYTTSYQPKEENKFAIVASKNYREQIIGTYSHQTKCEEAFADLINHLNTNSYQIMADK